MLCLLILWSSPLADPAKPNEVEQAVIDATNAERQEKKLPALKMNLKLMEAARAHAANMAKQDKLDHVLDDKKVADRVTKEKYTWRRVGENIAWGQKDSKAVLVSWMNSDGHRANILSDKFTEIGVAAVTNSKGELYWCQVFATPR